MTDIVERLRSLLTAAMFPERREIIEDAAGEIERLRTFARWVIKEGPFNGCNLDGGDVQDKAVELGILTETKYDPAIHGESDSAEPGDQWFVLDEQVAK